LGEASGRFRFGSKADLTAPKRRFRFIHESGPKKRDKTSGEFMAVKKSAKKFKRVKRGKSK
jgi:hypothetical protein